MMYDIAQAFQAIMQGQGMHRAKICAALFGVDVQTWRRWAATGDVPKGIKLSARNVAWSGAVLKAEYEKAQRGELKIGSVNPQKQGAALETDTEAKLPVRRDRLPANRQKV